MGLTAGEFITLGLAAPAPEMAAPAPGCADDMKKGAGSANETKNKVGCILLPDNYIFTNAAYIISDQCGDGIQCTAFREKSASRSGFRNASRSGFRKTFSGSILRQYSSAFEYAGNNCAAFDRRRRAPGNSDGFLSALRELLLNAIIHRDYSGKEYIQVNVYDGRIDIISPGGLARGLTVKEALSGAAPRPACRNGVLAGVFGKLGLFKGSGATISRVVSEYSGCLLLPAFRNTRTSFSASLPKMIGGVSPMRGHAQLKEELVLKAISQKGSITRVEVEQILKSSRNTAITLLDGLIDEGRIVKIGSARAVRYILPQ
jgi:ATP-dependent DNA helicase RecG